MSETSTRRSFLTRVAGGDTTPLVTPDSAPARVVVVAAIHEAARTPSRVEVG